MRFLQIRSACGWMFERMVRAFWLAASEFPKEQARISDLQKTLSKMRSANFKYNKSFFSGSFCLIHESLPSKSKFDIFHNLLNRQMILLKQFIHIKSIQQFFLHSIIQHFHIRISIESCDLLSESTF